MYRHAVDDGFPHRASFELTDEDLEAARAGVVPDLSQYPQPPPSAAQRQAAQAWTEWKVCRLHCTVLVVTKHYVSQAKYPDMLVNFQDFVAAAQHKRVAVFLDYDGVCIVKR